jgi:hypothetical protein
MKYLEKYWTFERCQDEALKYKSKVEFSNMNNGSFSAAYRKGWLDEICSHMNNKIIKPKNYWTYDKCKEESSQFKTKRDFFKNSQSAYSAAYKNGWLNDFFKNK